MPLRAGRAGSLSLSAAKKARCLEVRALVVSGGGGLLWKPSAGCRTGEVELPDKNSGANFLASDALDSECGDSRATRTYLGEVYAC
jgi:hypothetical protein